MGVSLNPDKLNYIERKLPFWDMHELTNEGIKINSQKPKAIMETPKSTNVEEVQRLIGFFLLPCKVPA